MRHHLGLTTALAAGLVLAAQASAQELTLRGFGGVTLAPEAHGDLIEAADPPENYTSEADLNSGFVIGGAAGVTFGDFRVDGELAYRTIDIESVTFSSSFGDYIYTPGGDPDFPLADDGHVVSLLANGWYDIPFTSKISGYVGGGVGVATADVGGFGSDAALAWQLGTGVRYALTEKVSVGGGYRYFKVEDAVDGEVTFSGSYTFGSDYADSSVLAEVAIAF